MVGIFEAAVLGVQFSVTGCVAMPKESGVAVSSSDLEALKESHQLVRSDTYDEQHCDSWKVRMARRYYNQLFKEYAIIDLSRYKEGQFGLRWRTEAEVLRMKGQQICGAKHCEAITELSTFELPFKYAEYGVVKRELIKVCLCEACSEKLHYCKHGGSSTAEASTHKRKVDEPSRGLKKHRSSP